MSTLDTTGLTRLQTKKLQVLLNGKTPSTTNSSTSQPHIDDNVLNGEQTYKRKGQLGDDDDDEQLLKMMNELVDADVMQVSRRLVITDANKNMKQIKIFLKELDRQQLKYTHYYTKPPLNTCNIHFKVPLRKNRRNQILRDLGLNLKCLTRKYNHHKHKLIEPAD